MLSMECRTELQEQWLPNISTSGLDRLIELLQTGSPYLISGCFSRASAMGCLATQIAWHDERTSHRHHDAGIVWLRTVAGVCPSQSAVIREWDSRGPRDLTLREDLLNALLDEKARREKMARSVPEPAMA